LILWIRFETLFKSPSTLHKDLQSILFVVTHFGPHVLKMMCTPFEPSTGV